MLNLVEHWLVQWMISTMNWTLTLLIVLIKLISSILILTPQKVLCLYKAIQMRDLRYLTQIYLESQRLALLYRICLGAHKWEMHVFWKIQQVYIRVTVMVFIINRPYDVSMLYSSMYYIICISSNWSWWSIMLMLWIGYVGYQHSCNTLVGACSSSGYVINGSVSLLLV